MIRTSRQSSSHETQTTAVDNATSTQTGSQTGSRTQAQTDSKTGTSKGLQSGTTASIEKANIGFQIAFSIGLNGTFPIGGANTPNNC